MLQGGFKDTLPAPNENIIFDEGMDRFFGRASGLKKNIYA